MGTKEIESGLTVKEKFLWLCLSYLLFFLTYGFGSWYASNSGNVHSIVFGFEHHIPFLSWMIIPYMSSGLFFIAVFFLCSSKSELYLLVKRINFITIISGLFFVVLPLKYSFVKPEVDGEFFDYFFRILNKWDTNFNQAPSLHVSYACIFWSVIQRKTQGILKIITGVWILLMIISTLTVYQHHIIDVITAFILVYITNLILT